MSDSDFTPKSNKHFGDNDGVTSCEPTILQIILKTGDVPSYEPTIFQNWRFEKSEKWDSTVEMSVYLYFADRDILSRPLASSSDDPKEPKLKRGVHRLSLVVNCRWEAFCDFMK